MRTWTSFSSVIFLMQHWDEKLLRNLLSGFRFYMDFKSANLEKDRRH